MLCFLLDQFFLHLCILPDHLYMSRASYMAACPPFVSAKVSMADATERVRVMLMNIFRLRRLWTLCFGDETKMRWVSYDQKPSWFNNAGLPPSWAEIVLCNNCSVCDVSERVGVSVS